MKVKFLDLGNQPIANGFLKPDQTKDEFFFNLSIGFDRETKLVSLMEFVDKGKLFNEDYVYVSSGSKTMRKHFKTTSKLIKDRFSPKKVLEIGSNDGVFIKNFARSKSLAVEPCGNFAELTNKLGYKTRASFWNQETSDNIVQEDGTVDVVFSANCMCHIPDLYNAFKAVESVLSPDGVFIFEDPSLDNMIVKNSFDQIYDEHAHIFSVIALSNVLNDAGLEIFDVQKLTVHGGSNRIFAKKKSNEWIKIEKSVKESLDKEVELGLGEFKTYENFAIRVQENKRQLVNLLKDLKNNNKKVIGYGATSKSTVVYNYCGIDRSLLFCVTDTTSYKQNKLAPGVHIPVVSPPDTGIDETVDYAFLGAWNFEKEIRQKEKKFLKRGGKFITHVPTVKVLEA